MMPDREKVIEGLTVMANDPWLLRHADYYQIISRDALELLKNDPVIPKKNDAWPSMIYNCGECGAPLLQLLGVKSKFCRMCGRKVKWE